MKIELDLPEIEGFEDQAEYRYAKSGEYALGEKDNAYMLDETSDLLCKYIILKKKAPVYETYESPVNGKWVKINALEDALVIIEDLAVSEEDRVVMRALKELIK